MITCHRLFNETAYRLGVEKLLGITDETLSGQRPRADDFTDLNAFGRIGDRGHGIKPTLINQYAS